MTEHPAPYSKGILDLVAAYFTKSPGKIRRVLDPFAGTGRIHDLGLAEIETFGLEIEPEWAEMHERTTCGDALSLPFPWPDFYFDAIVTSPTYGNRMADHHNARDLSKRITYRHKLGRELHQNNSGKLQWGRDYRTFHKTAWVGCRRALRPGGLFVLNVSNHIRGGEEIDVVKFHRDYLVDLGYVEENDFHIPTPRMGFGANRDLRVEYEHVIFFRKPDQGETQ